MDKTQGEIQRLPPKTAGAMIVPPLVRHINNELGKLAEQPLLGSTTDFPAPTFTFARKDGSGSKRPQAIAHRGFKAKFPENTMSAFRGAVDVGADAIETDVHLTRDGVVVLSHDRDLKRCFGRNEKLIDCDYEFISTLRTIQEPHERMPRLVDLLEYLAEPEPGRDEVWVMLDIKLDNDADTIMRLISDAIDSVKPHDSRPWHSRIVLGIWAAKYLPLCHTYLPSFPVTHIGFFLSYASCFFAAPNVSFNLHQAVLMTPWGRAFIRKAHCDRRAVFAWTVNDVKRMNWDIRQGLDGVVTDDPELFLSVRKNWCEGVREDIGLATWLDILRINLFALALGVLLRFKYGFNEGVLRRTRVVEVEAEE